MADRGESRELWICSECGSTADSRRWGAEPGNDDTATCPHCSFTHHDDEDSGVGCIVVRDFYEVCQLDEAAETWQEAATS